MSSRQPQQTKYKPGDLRKLKHAAAVVECDEHTIHKLSEAGLNFKIIALNPKAEGTQDPMYRVVWSTFETWLEERREVADRPTKKLKKILDRIG